MATSCSGHALLIALALTLPLSCGGGGSGAADPGTELFAGPADELVPHESGRSARFRVTARRDGSTDVSSFTSTVTGNTNDGTFTTRYASASGAIAEGTSRDLGDGFIWGRVAHRHGDKSREWKAARAELSLRIVAAAFPEYAERWSVVKNGSEPIGCVEVVQPPAEVRAAFKSLGVSLDDAAGMPTDFAKFLAAMGSVSVSPAQREWSERMLREIEV